MFIDDGCTFFPDQWQGQSLIECCAAHDEAMSTGTTWNEFVVSNTNLLYCAAEVSPVIAIIMFVGVMTVGALFFWFGVKKHRK